MPTHYVFSLAAKQDYERFYMTEMQNRKLQNYPPFYFLSSVNIKAKKEAVATQNAELVMEFLKDYFQDEKAIILGPITPFLSYRNETYEKQVLVKYKNADVAREIFTELFNTFKFKNNIEISINIDSYNF